MESLRIEQRHLACFSPNDEVLLRDPRGKSSRPSLYYEASSHGGTLLARGLFQLRYAYTVSRAQGVRFVDVTGDPNAIHREADIVAGTMTASKIIIPLEVLCPSLQIKSTTLKFVDWCHYGRRIRSVFKCMPDEQGGVSISVTAYQDERTIATAKVEGVVLDSPPHTPVKERKVNRQGLAAVKEYFHALGIESSGYFDKGDFTDYTYPFGYVLSLPTGEIVRQMSGQGGMLNVLRLRTMDASKIPVTGEDLPAVRLKRTRPKPTFNRIFADVIQGVVTYYKGSVLVNPNVQAAGT